MTRREIENTFAAYLLDDKDLDSTKLKEALLAALLDVHKMAEIESFLGIRHGTEKTGIELNEAIERYNDMEE